MTELYHLTPIGGMVLRADEAGLCGADLCTGSGPVPDALPCALLEQAARELDEYFAGTRRCFSVPLHPTGTPFEHRIWQALCRIPYGETRSYAELAAMAGHPGACRAAGSAIGRNPLLVFVPCHRVIRSDGSLGGFRAGLDVKKCLLALESNQNC